MACVGVSLCVDVSLGVQLGARPANVISAAPDGERGTTHGANHPFRDRCSSLKGMFRRLAHHQKYMAILMVVHMYNPLRGKTDEAEVINDHILQPVKMVLFTTPFMLYVSYSGFCLLHCSCYMYVNVTYDFSNISCH